MFIIETGRIIVPDTDPHAVLNTETFKYTIPVPAILVEHDQNGLVLMDAGIEPNHFAADAVHRLVYREENRIDHQLEKIGYRAEDVKHIIMSHWHRDHHNQLFLFPKATVYIREAELKGLQESHDLGFPPGEVEAFARFQRECPKAKIKLLPDVESCDIFGDGSIQTINSKGHTPGHQSFLLRLEKAGTWLFAMDAIHDESFLRDDVKIQRAWDVKEFQNSVKRLARYQDAGVKLIYGHDAEQWKELDLLPKYYE